MYYLTCVNTTKNTMKKIIAPLLVACCLLASCSTSPEKTFGIASLNCNMLYGFAGYELKRDLATPSEKLVDEKHWLPHQ